MPEINLNNNLENIEKLMSMLVIEITKIKASKNLPVMHQALLEIERVCKIRDDLDKKKTFLPLEQLKLAVDDLYLQGLGDKDQGEINGYLVTYQPGERFALDSEKLKDYFLSQEKTEEEMRNLLYSHKSTKASLKFKVIKY